MHRNNRDYSQSSETHPSGDYHRFIVINRTTKAEDDMISAGNLSKLMYVGLSMPEVRRRTTNKAKDKSQDLSAKLAGHVNVALYKCQQKWSAQATCPSWCTWDSQG